MEYYTTKRDFDYFCKRSRFWIKYFGLLDWDVDYDFDKEKGDHVAYCVSNLEGKAATIGFCRDWDETKPTKKQLDLAAFHEVCELLLSPLNILSKERFITESRVDEARHSIIRRLENTLLESSAGPKNIKS
jgi:hypothetical protein